MNKFTIEIPNVKHTVNILFPKELQQMKLVIALTHVTYSFLSLLRLPLIEQTLQQIESIKVIMPTPALPCPNLLYINANIIGKDAISNTCEFVLKSCTSFLK